MLKNANVKEKKYPQAGSLCEKLKGTLPFR